MAKKEPVSLLWQSIFMIIPILDLYAAYRIEKLRKYLLFIISFTIISVIVSLILFPVEDKFLDPGSWVQDTNFEGESGFSWGLELLAIGIAIVLIRKWSKKWNEQFSENTVNEETK